LYVEELLAPRPTPRLDDDPLSSVRDCLFNISAASLHPDRKIPLGRPRRRWVDNIKIYLRYMGWASLD
ncbi:hypothetical protein B7P43_G10985, partial [Cryptotermes secundus]